MYSLYKIHKDADDVQITLINLTLQQTGRAAANFWRMRMHHSARMRSECVLDPIWVETGNGLGTELCLSVTLTHVRVQ